MNNLATDLASLRIDRSPTARSRWRQLALLAMLICIPAAFGIYLISGRMTAEQVETVRPTVQGFAVATGKPLLTASGYLVARRKAVVSAKIQGRLAELHVDEGSQVGEGQVIARLDSADYEAQVEVVRAQVQRAEADLAEQQRELRITQNLAQAGVVSRDQLEVAMSRVRVAEASRSQNQATLLVSQANLQNTIIRAPFAGVVVKKMAEVGESVAPIPPGVNLSTSSGAIVAMTDMATLEAEVDVSESNVAKLHHGQPAQVSVEAFPDRLYRARLRQVIPTADRTKATVTMKVSILDLDDNLKPEMSVKVTFLQQVNGRHAPSAGTGPVIRVPKDSTASRNGTTVVFEVRNGNKVHVVPVIVGSEYQDQVIVKQGLTGSELLISHPPEKLKEGDTVQAKE